MQKYPQLTPAAWMLTDPFSLLYVTNGRVIVWVQALLPPGIGQCADSKVAMRRKIRQALAIKSKMRQVLDVAARLYVHNTSLSLIHFHLFVPVLHYHFSVFIAKFILGHSVQQSLHLYAPKLSAFRLPHSLFAASLQISNMHDSLHTAVCRRISGGKRTHVVHPNVMSSLAARMPCAVKRSHNSKPKIFRTSSVLIAGSEADGIVKRSLCCFASQFAHGRVRGL